MQSILVAAGFLLMLAGPLMQGLAGNSDPLAYVFAPILLAGSIPLIAGRNISPYPLRMVVAILICGAICMGLWYLGVMFGGGVQMPGWLPLGSAILGAVIASASRLLVR